MGPQALGEGPGPHVSHPLPRGASPSCPSPPWQHPSGTAYFSLSPSHFDIRSEDDTEKKVELLASVATALAR